MVQDILSCDVKFITNKRYRVIVISHLIAMGVRPNICMKLIGYTSIDGYMLQHQ